MTILEALYRAATATGATLDMAVLGADQAVESGWDVVTRADGVRARLDFAPGSTSQQKADARAAVLAADLTPTGLATIQTQQLRSDAVALLSAAQALGVSLRAVAVVLVNEINLLRERCAAQDAAVATANTLVDLKARWAAVASAQPLPDRTVAQAKAALASAATGGAAD